MSLRFTNNRLYWQALRGNAIHDSGVVLRLPDMASFFEKITCDDNTSYRCYAQVQRYLERDLSNPEYDLLDQPFDMSDLTTGIRQLKRGKAAGHD